MLPDGLCTKLAVEVKQPDLGPRWANPLLGLGCEWEKERTEIDMIYDKMCFET